MLSHAKIFNDPVYGFVSVPYDGLLLRLIDHPVFQRLRRIRQLGLSAYVYPGALHTRFHHALGALHLMQEVLEVLKAKGVAVTDEECEGVCAAILLHDIGHGPFSHALEHTLVDRHHEELSMLFMEALNQEVGGRLELAMDIFADRYPKRFLHQLVSGQLDMDRMDYLNRDSFFTGVSEGVIGYDRIIKMIHVHDGNLVVEEKGIYSIEKFLIARRLMYWQVYLHKTSVSAEQMLIHLLQRARELALAGYDLDASRALRWFLYRQPGAGADNAELLHHFSRLDDTDIVAANKAWADDPDPVLSFLAQGLLNRRLFRLEWHTTPLPEAQAAAIRQRAYDLFQDTIPLQYLVYEGFVSNQAYDEAHDQIRIRFKNNTVKPISEYSDVPLYTQLITKYFICYPKIAS